MSQRREKAMKAIAELAMSQEQNVRIIDYRRLRAKRPDLPPLSFIYESFGSWSAALAAAGVSHSRPQRRFTGTSDEQMLDALRICAADRGGPVSSHAYDAYRRNSPVALPSSSSIRKRLGSWPSALEKAGVAGGRSQEAWTIGRVIDALRRAMGIHGDDDSFDQSAYEGISSGAAGQWPSIGRIAGLIGSWEAAIRATRGESGDNITFASGCTTSPTMMWTQREIARIVSNLALIGIDPITSDAYERVCVQSTRHLPDWSLVKGYLDSRETDAPNRSR